MTFPASSKSNLASTRSLRSFAPAALVLSGVLIGALMTPMLAPSPASAQDRGDKTASDGPSPFNSGDQRRQMIAQLTEMNSRLTKIEAKLNSGLSVKVTEMPAVVVKDNNSGK